MLRVRYPNGTVVTYNDATYLRHDANAWHLYTKKDGGWVASLQASSGAIIERIAPCSVVGPNMKPEGLVDAVLALCEGRLAYWPLAEKLSALKAALAQFDRRTKTWKGR